MDRYLCVHGHFYQPPRENPWLEAIELQDSAYPYHDWNERITDECYRPNAHSRILRDDRSIARIINNYSKISFNFGPTLLAWLEAKEPEVYQAILAADQLSKERFSGHGSAMAQGFNHAILPLCNNRDRRTQVIWGIADFEMRFGRRPEGMWLPETAANTATLEALAEQDIVFTVLAPRQAKRVRKIGGEWEDPAKGVDPSRAYLATLPSGRSINLFFYDGPISQAVAFEGLLNSGEGFARRLTSGFSEERHWPQLMHIATDGETYGHHHRHGDMALSYALQYIEGRKVAQLTNYAEYLERHPPEYEVEIVDDSSWSCVHGIGRWREDCGCHTGMHADWNQEWRRPLRESLDWLRDAIIPLFEGVGGAIFEDPWAARDDYVELILDRSDESAAAFLNRHAKHTLNRDEAIRAIKLMELQRHAMLMYTSCGWFFDELSGIETVQVIQYAGRVIQLAEELFETAKFENEFVSRLSAARSNIPRESDGGSIYERYVKPTAIDLPEVGAHYAISSLFEEYPETTEIYCYNADRRKRQRFTAGRSRLEVGRVRLTSRITQETDELSYAVLHLGDHIMNGGVRSFVDDETYQSLIEDAEDAFNRGDIAEVLRLMNDAFGESNYSLGSLFRDEQRHVTDLVLESTLTDIEASYERIYNDHAGLMRFLHGLHIPVPGSLLRPAEFVMTARFRDALAASPPDIERMRTIVDESQRHAVEFDHVSLSFDVEKALSGRADYLLAQPDDIEALDRLRELIHLVSELPFDVDLAEVQNRYYELWKNRRPEIEKRAKHRDESATEWLAAFESVGEALQMKIEE